MVQYYTGLAVCFIGGFMIGAVSCDPVITILGTIVCCVGWRFSSYGDLV